MQPNSIMSHSMSTVPTHRTKAVARWLLAIALLVVGFKFAASQHAQSSGPFAYFNTLPGSRAAYDKGKDLIDDWVKKGSNAVTALQKFSAAGFTCSAILRPTRNPRYLSVPATKMTEEELLEGNFYYSRCYYSFGFFGEDWYAVFVSNDRQEIVRSSNGVTPVLGI